MRAVVTGSAGHLGEAIARTLRGESHEVRGLDLHDSPYTTHVGSVADGAFVNTCVRGCDVVFHTATLHKPHVATHTRRAFVETNVIGTMEVLEAALSAGAIVVFTSTTSAFGAALGSEDAGDATWVTEELGSVPKNIYGATKEAAEAMCELFARTRGLPCIVLRTSRFFPEMDDNRGLRDTYSDANLKANEFLHRRVDLTDAVGAHLQAAEHAAKIRFGRYIVSATTPFRESNLEGLGRDAPSVVRQLYPEYQDQYARRGWSMYPRIGRVYVNERARHELDWVPRHDYQHVLSCLARDKDFFSPMTRAVGEKGYHSEPFNVGPYPVEENA